MRSLLTPEGGFAVRAAEPRVADVTSTAAVLRALIAAGEDPTSPEWGNVPLALARFWSAGGFRSLLSDTAPELPASLQAISAMQEKPLPIKQMCDS